MRLAALYDIHGNLPALEAVLADIRRIGVDHVVVGGDVIPGPMARETIACLRDLEIPKHYIQGNGETEVLAELAGRETGNVPEQFREIIRWVAGQLTPTDERELSQWPMHVTLEIPGVGDVLFCHATPRNNTEIFTHLTAEQSLRSAFASARASLVVCGHTHIQFERKLGDLRVVNAGSVGMPFGEPGAYWLLLGPDVQLRRTDFDLAAAAARIRTTDYPQADDFAQRNVLNPPSEAHMLEVYARAELR